MDISRYNIKKKPLCEVCEDAARKSLSQEIREGLKIRGLWYGETDSDLITAVFMQIDKITAD